jgi:Carboxypeptidase regulatory-like domain
MSSVGTIYNNQTSHLDFDFSLVAAGSIVGQISIDGSQPASNASVYILPRSSSGTNYAGYADANGYYSAASLSTNDYDVHISGVAGYPNQMWGMISVGSGPVTADFNMVKGSSTITGRVTNSQGQYLAGAKVQIFCWEPNPCTYAEAYTDAQGQYTVTDMWGGKYVAYSDFGSYARVTKNNLSVPGTGTTIIDFVMGGSPALVADSSNVAVLAEGSYGTYRTVFLDVSSGSNVPWSASIPWNVKWLYLGSSGTSRTTSGVTGVDVLWMQFHPENVSNGTYSTTISVTSPSASSIQITVTMVKTTAAYHIYLPFLKR